MDHKQHHGHHHHHHHNDLKNNLHNKLVENELAFLLGKLQFKNGENYLDYGCSNGDTTIKYIYPIAEKYSCKIIGVDLNPDSIEKAKEKHSKDLVTWSQGNIVDPGNWTWGNEKFDKVFCLHVVQYFDEFGQFLKLIWDQMRNGGQFAFSIPISRLTLLNNEIKTNQIWKPYIEDKFPQLGSWSYSPDFMPEMKTTLEKIGFQIQEFQLAPQDQEFEQGIEGFADFLIGHWKGFLVPPEKSADFRDYIVKTAADIFEVKVDEKPFKLNIPTLRVIVQKP